MTHIFVGNLSWATTHADLQALFARFEGVEHIDVVTNQDNGQPRGFALVRMTAGAAQVILAQLEGVKIHGRPITLREVPENHTLSSPKRR